MAPPKKVFKDVSDGDNGKTLFALRFKKTIFVYNNVTQNTLVFYYNQDLGKVQCSAQLKGWVYPLANSVCVLYNNSNHYDLVQPNS